MTGVNVNHFTEGGRHRFVGGPFDGGSIDELPADCVNVVGNLYAWHVVLESGRLSDGVHVYRRDADCWRFVVTQQSHLTAAQRGW